jgi:integrase
MSSIPFIETDEPPRFLSQDEVRSFLCTIQPLRDLVLFTLTYQYALRVGEIPRLRVKDIDLEAKRIVVRRLKRGIWGIRPLFENTSRLLALYLETMPRALRESDAPLFPGRNGPLRKRRIQQLFRRYASEAGIRTTASCHSLRHAIATHLLDAGESLEFVKDHLGHRKIENTSIYARVSNPARDRAFARLEQSDAMVHPRVLAQNTSTRTDSKSEGRLR